MWPEEEKKRSDRVWASTTRGEPPSYHGKMHTHGTLQHPVHANRRLIRPLGTTQKHPNGQWSLLLVRCAPVRCVLYTEDNSRNSPLVYLLTVYTAVQNTHDLTLDIPTLPRNGKSIQEHMYAYLYEKCQSKKLSNQENSTQHSTQEYGCTAVC